MVHICRTERNEDYFRWVLFRCRDFHLVLEALEEQSEVVPVVLVGHHLHGRWNLHRRLLVKAAVILLR